MTVGIYKLNFNGTDKIYIGQSNNIELRYNIHRTTLNCGKGTKKLQEAYNSFGMPSIEILVKCCIEELDANEIEAIEIFDAVKNGFNTREVATHRSELYGDLTGNSKYTNAQVEEVFMYLVDNVLTHKEITEITNVSRGAVSDISSGSTHMWLAEVYPEKYKKLIALKGSNRRRNKMTAKSRNRPYPQVVSPQGIQYTVDSLRGFCREHDLNHGSFGEMLRGHRSSCSGWKIIS
jgi:predicted DNA-binding protein YlxM (UPF0122 family)